MGEKLVVGSSFNRGFRNDRPSFMFDNDSFPQLLNAYQHRGRVKRKRGTSPLGRLTRLIETQSIGNTSASPWSFNLFTVAGITAEPNASIQPGTVQIFLNPTNITGNLVPSSITSPPGLAYTNDNDCEVFSNTLVGLKNGDQVTISGVVIVPNSGVNEINQTWPKIELIPLNTSFKIGKDSHLWGRWQSGGTWTKIVGAISFADDGNGNLVSTTPGNSGTINYATGAIVLTHTAGAGAPASATFGYFPTLPVMGLEDFITTDQDYPAKIGFDTVYSYNITPQEPFIIYAVNFYKNPVSGTYPGYVQKAPQTTFVWNGEDYQQFWTTNYQNAMWATNGITVPFNRENIGMQFAQSSDNTMPNFIVSATQTSPTTVDFVITNSPLVVGDFLFANEFTGGSAETLNFQTGYVTAVNTGTNTYTVKFPNAVIGGAGLTPGILQYLTNSSDPTKDCLRWYDGDPTLNAGINGWVNFMPPLSQLNYSIAELPAAQYYLIGARMIVPFKDRLLFIGAVVQTSAANSQRYLIDTVIYSQNGTPYYTASFDTTGIVNPFTSPLTQYFPILTPSNVSDTVNQTSTINAWFEDSTGFGGFASAAIDQPINTVSSNQDVLLMGFNTTQARFIYTGNDIVPFEFFIINSELGSQSVFSTINLDKGSLTSGTRGFILTSQQNALRFDLEIPDETFKISLPNNGAERFTAQRDFENEWVYFTYPSDYTSNIFPNQTLFYNYRDNSWAVFNESYTHYGQFQRVTGYTWLTIPWTWENWNEPWNSGESTPLQPEVIAGNQQGFIVFREDNTTEECPSLAISNIVGSVVTSVNHNLNDGDYIIISDADGTVASQVNGKIFQIQNPTSSVFTINPSIVGGTYIGGGVITRLFIPLIMTKQFPTSWGMGRKTRIGVQQYLLTKTGRSQITLLLFLSQNSITAWNNSPVIPAPNVTNSSLIYSTILYTCPESTNLGLTPANTNLQQLTALDSTNAASNDQQQVWHRVNTSLIGDTVQIGFTLSDTQMRAVDDDGKPISQMTEIELHCMILDLNPSQMLS